MTRGIGLDGTICQTLVSDIMKTISLRTLVREPLTVKRITSSGQPVQVTDRGRPLWVIHPADGPDDPDRAERRRREIEAGLADVLRGPRSTRRLSVLVIKARR
jgi:antitoxin (DNA-binding transcriptional repressor) of toxin-antitoxin stability system